MQTWNVTFIQRVWEQEATHTIICCLFRITHEEAHCLHRHQCTGAWQCPTIMPCIAPRRKILFTQGLSDIPSELPSKRHFVPGSNCDHDDLVRDELICMDENILAQARGARYRDEYSCGRRHIKTTSPSSRSFVPPKRFSWATTSQEVLQRHIDPAKEKNE